MNKIYLSGTIEGRNYGMYFDHAEKVLKSSGFEVLNPLNIFVPFGLDDEEEQQACMRIGLQWLLQCTHICYVNNEKMSDAAKIEKAIAESLGLIIIDIDMPHFE